MTHVFDEQQQQHQQHQCVVDVDAVTLTKLSDGHSSFCSLMTDRLQCLNSVQELLQEDGNFKVCEFARVCVYT